jgi:hypothetical protein
VDAEDRLHQDLEWAGLQCDEGLPNDEEEKKPAND